MSRSGYISTIIPTASRPGYLPRAISSALASSPPNTAEIIVVPNGPDETWKQTLKPYIVNKIVKVIQIPIANANNARNIGLAHATGEYIRFLDDDDYLIPKGAEQQYNILRKSDFDLVSCSIELVNHEGKCFRTWEQNDSSDFCVATLGPWRKCQGTAHLYRYTLIKDLIWNPETIKSQDLEWHFDLCASKEVKWLRTNTVVGVWQHHWDKRVSANLSHNQARKQIANMLIRTYDKLSNSNRLDDSRRNAAATGLWGLVQDSFYLEPSYWKDIAEIAIKIDSTARPTQQIYKTKIINIISPLTLQYIMFPKRFLFHQIRKLLSLLRIRHIW